MVISKQTIDFIEVSNWLVLKEKVRFKKDIAAAMAMIPQTFSQIVSKHRNITDEQYEKFKAVYKEELKEYRLAQQGIVNEPGNEYSTEMSIPAAVGAYKVMWVPLVSIYAYAGYMSGYGDAEYISALPLEPFMVDRDYKGNYLCFEIRGDSMDDGTRDSICARDIVLAREIGRDHWRSKLHLNKWNFIIVTKEDGIICKQIIDHDTERGEITVHSLNAMYEDKKIALNQVVQIFNIVRVTRPY